MVWWLLIVGLFGYFLGASSMLFAIALSQSASDNDLDESLFSPSESSSDQ